MEKTKSCKRKMRIAIGILLLEFAYMGYCCFNVFDLEDKTGK